MAVRTSFDIPEPLYEALRQRAQQQRTSLRAVVLRALEQEVQPERGRRRVTGPLVDLKGGPGPLFPTDENPQDLIFP